jgi:L-threonylcarbamoyladenylate synthase
MPHESVHAAGQVRYDRRVLVAPERISRAIEILADGGLVAFPTETVYGIGAVATHEIAVDRIYDLKGRPRTRALIVHIASAAVLDAFSRSTPDAAAKLAEEFWPGPLTIVLERATTIPDIVTGGGNTVGLRVPKHPVPIELIEGLTERAGAPVGIAAPSASRFGEPPATTAQEVVARLGAPSDDPGTPDLIVDGGACPGKVVSTIISCVSDVPRLLRRGAVSVEAIEDTLGRFVKK